jgi:SAM-dependent methyltransferase
MLFSYGVGIGIQALTHAHITKEAVKNVVVPTSYWRTLEYRLTYEALQPNAADRILDIGSPKLLSLYIAQHTGAAVFATDLDGYFIPDYTYFRDLRGIPEERYRLLEADGRSLPFGDGEFTKVYSISVLEHIPGMGDSECVREIARVLKPGGVLVATVPFGPKGRVELRDAGRFYWSGSMGKSKNDGKVFFQRRYCDSDIRKRIVQPSGLAVRSIGYFGEKVTLGPVRENTAYLPPLTGLIQPIASWMFLRGPEPTWQDIPNPRGAMIVLEKGA